MNDKKIVIAILDDLATWQKLNVVSFLTSSIASRFPETHGEDLVTADGKTFLPLLKHPIVLYKATSQADLQRALRRSLDRELSIGIFTKPLFDTRTGEENVAEIAKYSVDDLDLVGLIVYGDNKKVNKAIDNLKFHD